MGIVSCYQWVDMLLYDPSLCTFHYIKSTPLHCLLPHLFISLSSRSMHDEHEVFEFCNGSHNDVARIAHRLLAGRYVCASPDGKVWYAFGGLWALDAGAIGIRHALSTTVREHFVSALNLNFELTTDACKDGMRAVLASSRSRRGETAKLLSIAFKLQDAGFKDGVMKEMREYFFDATFMQHLDADPNLIGFKNGVFDLKILKRKCFRAAVPEDYVSLTTGCEYRDDDGIEDADARRQVERYWETLHPDAEQRCYVQATFARQLYGDHGQELFHIHAGHRASAENGKSKFFDVLERCLGGYVRKFGVEMLTAKQRIEPGKPMPEFEPWRGVRILYCTEPNHDDVLNSGILKDLTGGEAVMYRLLFSNIVQQFRPQFKLHIMCNDAPIVDGSDSGVKRRIRKLDYVSRFVDVAEVAAERHMYARDPGLVEGFKSSDAMRLAFVKSLLHAYDHDWTFTMPEVVQASSQVYLQENDAVHKFVKERVQLHAGCWFTLKQAREEFKASEHFNGKLKTLRTDLEKTLGTVCLDQKRVDGCKEVNVFIGFKITSTTSSASELRFKDALKEMGCKFQSGVHPEWLVNEVTKCTMELDLYNEEKKLAVEYDGPQHYEFPNGYHKSEAEFHAQQNRDRQKDATCARLGVTLLRVRASDLEEELRSFREQYEEYLRLQLQH